MSRQHIPRAGLGKPHAALRWFIEGPIPNNLRATRHIRVGSNAAHDRRGICRSANRPVLPGVHRQYCTRQNRSNQRERVAASGVLALLRAVCRRIGQGLQFDDGRCRVTVPHVSGVAVSGNPAWQGQHLCFDGGLLLGELQLESRLVAPQLGGMDGEPGCLGPGLVQLAAQFAIAALQHLKEPDVLKTLGMQFFPHPPGIGGLLSHHRGSSHPDFAPGEDAGNDAADNCDQHCGTGHPDPTKSDGNSDDSRPEQREPRVTAQRGRIRFSRRDGGIHEAESSQPGPYFPE